MTIKILNLGWETTLKRYFLMMLLVIVGVLTKTWVLAFLGLPVFFTAILGISFKTKETKTKQLTKETSKVVALDQKTIKKAM